MARLRIRTWGDPILKTRAQEVRQINDELKRLIKDMAETLQAENGVGLAANQVGAAWRVFVAEIPSQVGPSQRYALINPKIISLSRETEMLDEGCLSFPGIYGPVERHVAVKIAGQDVNGKTVTLDATGLLARAFQHELDHLDGVVFIERMKLVQRLMLNRQLNELAKHTHAALAGRGTPKI
jgi:peptide deformylase